MEKKGSCLKSRFAYGTQEDGCHGQYPKANDETIHLFAGSSTTKNRWQNVKLTVYLKSYIYNLLDDYEKKSAVGHVRENITKVSSIMENKGKGKRIEVNVVILSRRMRRKFQACLKIRPQIEFTTQCILLL